jgi:uroporphyrinogen decarboxylase
MSTLDYFVCGPRWTEANLAAVRRFPQVMFLPGFWAEFGMCTEPSAFGTKCTWHENDLPFAHPVLRTPDEMAALARPDVRTDGLLPLVLKRLQHARPHIEAKGHAIRFAVARGPLNIASFLAGSTELLMALKTNPQEVHALLATITDFLCDWLRLQAETLPSIQGIFLLDDIVGFLGLADCRTFALPYLKKAFGAFPARARFFHNDAHGLVCAPMLEEMGVNLFNFSFQHSLSEMRQAAGPNVTLLGNLPPRDVLAAGSPEDVRKGVRAMLDGLPHHRRLIASCGGGLPPAVPSQNLDAFVKTVRECP